MKKALKLTGKTRYQDKKVRYNKGDLADTGLHLQQIKIFLKHVLF